MVIAENQAMWLIGVDVEHPGEVGGILGPMRGARRPAHQLCSVTSGSRWAGRDAAVPPV
ncbi:hypothetical protein [Streptosporangium sandarakinum]|uniref:Uncharacterized protein n=1 Tax=Streptosporangium sandarakinum TaxID=1260955 RepID=A0A852V8H7_9ACTN|nr:hypothetical protein [Streptosporangium sandarakinum]NYF44396.1 hypothetical protein [Streptosporangium sandarakinum]